MLKIHPPIWYFILLGGGLLLHFLVPASHLFDLSGWPFNAMGIILFILGFGLSLQGSRQFAQNDTEILPTSPTNRVLVTDGLYRFSRNPMYLGMLLSLVGIGLFIGTPPVIAAGLVHALVMNFVHIPFEEAKMARQFGQQYSDYLSRVRRWI